MQKRGIVVVSILIVVVGFFAGRYIAMGQAADKNQDILLENSFLNNGWQDFDNGLYESSRETFEKQIRSDPTNFYAQVGLAWSYFFLSDFNNAKTHFTKASHLEPSHFLSLAGLGITELHDKNYEQAIHYFENALAAGPDHQFGELVFTGLGYGYYHAGEHSKSETAFRNALDYNSQSLLANTGWIMNYRHNEQFTQAQLIVDNLHSLSYSHTLRNPDALHLFECIREDYRITTVTNCGDQLYA